MESVFIEIMITGLLLSTSASVTLMRLRPTSVPANQGSSSRSAPSTTGIDSLTAISVFTTMLLLGLFLDRVSCLVFGQL